MSRPRSSAFNIFTASSFQAYRQNRAEMTAAALGMQQLPAPHRLIAISEQAADEYAFYRVYGQNNQGQACSIKETADYLQRMPSEDPAARVHQQVLINRYRLIEQQKAAKAALKA